MNRLAMIAATGFFALLLTACGDNGKPADTKTDTTTQQTQTKSDDGKNADTQTHTEGQSQ